MGYRRCVIDYRDPRASRPYAAMPASGAESTHTGAHTAMRNRPILDAIADMIADHESVMARLVAEKPTVTDGHSDGKRVRYVKAETAAATLRAIMDIVANGGAA
jgi:hypothetical protein